MSWKHYKTVAATLVICGYRMHS